MDSIRKDSCDGFPSSSSTSSKSRINFPFQRPEEPPGEPKQEPAECLFSRSSSSSTTIAAGFFKDKESECKLGKSVVEAPNIRYEVAVAKSILQQCSILSGDNLFDHLSDIIKRTIDERPPNVIDFFEEFSRNVREQKFHLPERFPNNAIFEELRMFRVAKRMMAAMKLPQPLTSGGEENGAEELVEEGLFGQDLNYDSDDLILDIAGNAHLFKYFNERVQQLQFYWNQCGFSISSDDIFQLALAMHRLQSHPSILQCRFWGVINGLKKSYYVVEASLTQEELVRRLEQMESEMRANYAPADPAALPEDISQHIQKKRELIPGAVGWEHWPQEELDSMLPAAEPVPEVVTVEVFDAPPEPIGLGTNRYSYFVINTFSDDWMELPIVTPRQIVISRQIKKFFTGDLEAEVISYPCFPGKEKHYLRAMIARITAGTYIAPEGYYRKMTKKEKRLYDGTEDDEEEEAEEEEEELMGEGEEGEVDNDVILLKNENYDPMSLSSLAALHHWLHVRPNILPQGRVVWLDLEKARIERIKELERLRKLENAPEGEEEEEKEEEAEEEEMGEGEEEEEIPADKEVGPPILSPCSLDISDQFIVSWVARFTSQYVNRNERVIILKSKTWPGAYTFAFDKVSESIYMGWGHKYVARNMPFHHLRPLLSEFPHTSQDFIEAEDPTYEEEENYRLGLLRKTLHSLSDGAEHLSDFEVESESEAN